MVYLARFSLKTPFIAMAIIGALIVSWPVLRFVLSGFATCGPLPPLQAAIDTLEDEPVACQWRQMAPDEYEFEIGGAMSVDAANAVVLAPEVAIVKATAPQTAVAHEVLSKAFDRSESGGVVVWRRRPEPSEWEKWGL
ncbi:MAG: hypothetical protein U0836_19900 [Pirellulales bacterium]